MTEPRLTTADIPRITALLSKAHGRERWLLEVARLNILLPDGVPLATLAAEWGISEDAALARMEEINTLGPMVDGDMA